MLNFIFDLQRFAASVTLWQVDGTKYAFGSTETEASSATTSYESITAALESLEAGSTVILGEDLDFSSASDNSSDIVIKHSLTLDLAGHTLNMGANAIYIADKYNKTKVTGVDDTVDVVIKNSNTAGAGGIHGSNIGSTDNGTGGVIFVEGEGKSLTLQTGVKVFGEGSTDQYTIKILNKASGTMEAGSAIIMNQSNAIDNEQFKSGDQGVKALRVYNSASFTMTGGDIYSYYNGKYDASKKKIEDIGVCVFDNSTFKMTGGKIQTYEGAAVSGNGTVNAGYETYGMYATIDISGTATGTVLTSAKGPAIYFPTSQGKMNISGGTITGGESAVEIRGGTTEITGGTFNVATSTYSYGTSTTNQERNVPTATSTDVNTYSYAANNNGATTVGAAIAIATYDTDDIKVDVTGGSFSGGVGLSVANPSSYGKYAEVNISGSSTTFTGRANSFTSQLVKSGDQATTYTHSGGVAVNVADSNASVNIMGGTFTGTITKENANSSTDSTNSSASDTGGSYSLTTGVKFNSAANVPTEYSTKGFVDSAGTTINIDAGDNVAQVGTTLYTSLQAAIKAANEASAKGINSTVILLKDITTTSTLQGSSTLPLSISGNVTLNLNGKNISTTGGSLFTVANDGKFTITDTQSTVGSITATGTSGNLFAVSGSGTFNLEAGTINAASTAFNVTGGTVNITGDKTTINIGSKNQVYAIQYSGSTASTINFGEEGDTSSGPKINFTSSYSHATQAVSAIYGSNDATNSILNIYSGTVSIAADDANDYAVNIGGGKVNITGGNLSAQEVALYLDTSNLDASIDSANLEATGTEDAYGIYINTAAKKIEIGEHTTVKGGNFAVGGSEAGITSSTTTYNFALGSQFINGTAATTTSDYYYYTTNEAGTSSNISFNQATLVANAGNASAKKQNDKKWDYTFGNTETGYVGKKVDVTFNGDLFDGDKLDAIADNITISGTTISVSDTLNFALKDGNNIQVESGSGYTFNAKTTESGETSPFTYAANYKETGTFAGIEGETGKYVYTGKGADNEGFTESGNTLTYHTARTDVFTVESGINLGATSSDAEQGAMAGYLDVATVASSDGTTLVTIKDNNFFGTNGEDNNRKTLFIAGGNYKFSLASDLSDITTYSDSPTFTISAVEKAEANGHSSIATFYTPGAKNKGYAEGDGTITYYDAGAPKIQFLQYGQGTESGKYLNFNTLAAGTTMPSGWFTFDTLSVTEGTGYQLTINTALAFDTLQTNGAQLKLETGYPKNLTLAYSGLDSNNVYWNEVGINTLSASNDVNTYRFHDEGMFLANGFVTVENESAKSAPLLEYHNKANQATLTASGLTLDTTEAGAKTYYSFGEGDAATVLTINKAAAIAGYDEGDSLTISEGFRLALESGEFGVIDSGTINAKKKYENLTYTGVGAQEAGWATIKSGFAYHQKYDTFTFESGTDTIALTNAFADAVTVTSVNLGSETGHRIVISPDAIDQTTLKSGNTLSLNSASTNKKYFLQLAEGFSDSLVTEVYRDETLVQGKSAYTWNSKGGDKNGYQLTTSSDEAGSGEQDLVKLTYWDKSTELKFNVDGIKLNTTKANAISIVDNNKVSINSAVLESGQDVSSKLYITSDNKSDYTLVLGDGVTTAKGDTRDTATFNNSANDTVYVYTGIGAAEEAGYKLDSTSSTITYYGEAVDFTLEGDIKFNTLSAATQKDSDKYFDLSKPGEIGVYASAIDTTDIKTGDYFQLSDNTTGYKLVFTDNDKLNKVESGDVNKNENLTENAYTGVGVTKDGGEAGFLNSNNTLFTYYDIADTFKTEAGDSYLKFETGLASTLIADAISIDTISGSTVKAITFNDSTVFAAMSNTASLALDENSAKNYKMVFNFGSDDKLTTLAAGQFTNVQTLTSSGSGTGTTYTYSSVGADAAGFYQNSDSVATYYDKAVTLGFAGDVTLGTGDNFNASNFTITSATTADGIGTVAISVGALFNTESLVGGETLNLTTDGYRLSLAGSGWDTTDFNYSAAVTSLNSSEKDPVHMYEYKFAGAENNGFKFDDTNTTTQINYYKAADRFTLEGSIGLTNTVTGAFTPNQDDGSVKLNSRFLVSDDLKQGASLTIATVEGATKNYHLVLGDLAAAANTQDAATFDGETYKGIGAETAGFVEKDSVLTYYGKYDQFAFATGDSYVALNALATNVSASTYFEVASVDSAMNVTIHTAAINEASLAGGQILKFADAYSSGYKLILDNPVATSNFNLEAKIENTITYTGVGYNGNDKGAFYANSDTLYTYYDPYKTFTIESYTSGNGYFVFKGTSDQISSIVADAFSFGTVLSGNQTLTSVTINDGRVFDFASTSGMVNGAKLALANTSSGYKLFLGADNDAASLNVLGASDVHTISVMGGQVGSYTYTGVGGNERGFHQADTQSAITYYEASEKFTIAGNLALNIDDSNFGNYFSVDEENNQVTIGWGAFDTTAMEDKQYLTILTNEDTAYNIVLDKTEANSLTAVTTQAATWDPYTNTWTAAGAPERSFTLSEGERASVMTFNAPAAAVKFSVSDIDSNGADLSFADGTKNAISLVGADGKTVSVASGIFGSSDPTISGAYFELDTLSSKAGYTLDASALATTVESNTYLSEITLTETGTDSYTYNNIGMSSVSGFTVTAGDNGNRATWYRKADIFSFDTSGGIEFTDAAKENITIATGSTEITINGAALNTANLNNNNYISLTTDGYTLKLGSGLTPIQKTEIAPASFTGSNKTFKSKGSKGAPGYSVEGDNALTYYKSQETIVFDGTLNFTTDAVAVNHIHVNGSEITVDKEALSLSAADNGKTLTVIDGGTNNAALAKGDLTTVGSGLTQAQFDPTAKTYTGAGASVEGFTYNDGTLTYYKQNNAFAFDSTSDMQFASTVTTSYDADSLFAVTGPTMDGDSVKAQGTIIIKDTGMFASLANGNKLVLGSAYASLYDFGEIASSMISESAVVTVNSFDTSTNVLTIAGGATSTGYLISTLSSGNEALTYYTVADKVSFGAAGNGDSIKFDTAITGSEWNSNILVANDGTITFSQYAFNTASLKGGETLKLNNLSTVTGGVEYKLAIGNLAEADQTVAAALNAQTKVYQAEGAETEGYGVANDILTYYAKAQQVSLNSSADFAAIDSASIDTYFSFADNVLTIKNAGFLASLTNGITVGLADGENNSLAVASNVSIASDKFSSVNTLSGKTFTSAGGTDNAGFVSDHDTLFTYYNKSDSIEFAGTANFNTNNTLAAESIYLTAGTGADSAKTVVTFGSDAFSISMADGSVMSLASSSQSSYMIAQGELDSATNYYSAAVLQTLGSSEYAYYGKGADNAGFDFATASGGALTYHTAREDAFTLGGGIVLASMGADDATTFGGYFTVGTISGSTEKLVTVNKQLFAENASQTGGTSLSIAGGNYQLTLASADQVDWINTTTFSGTEYKGAGASVAGYRASLGAINYYNAAPQFTFATNGNYIKLNTPALNQDVSDWFTVEGGIVSIGEKALATDQENGATLGFASSNGDYTIDGSALFIEGNEFYSVATFNANEVGGGIYTSKGMSDSAGYADDNGVLTYYNVNTPVTINGSVLFNDVPTDSMDSAFALSGTNLTIGSAALASAQANLATMQAAGYNLVLDSGVATASGLSTVASITRGTYTGVGANTAGYSLSGGVITYYGQPDKFAIGGKALVNPNINDSLKNADTAPIRITGVTGDKTVTIYDGLFLNLVSGKSNFDISAVTGGPETSYKVSLDSGIDGGTYDANSAFAKKNTETVEGVATYTYTYKTSGGGDRAGFIDVNKNGTYTYYTAADQIAFTGTLDMNDVTVSTQLENYFAFGEAVDSVTPISIKSADIFNAANNYDSYSIALASDVTNYSLAFDTVFSATVSGEKDEITFSSNNNGYTYQGTGASVSGYKLSDGAIVYRAPIDEVTFNGDVVLDTEKGKDAIEVDGLKKTITIGKDALGTQTAENATLSVDSFKRGDTDVTGYTLAFNADDSVTPWNHVNASLAAADADGKRVYTSEGYDVEGYTVENNVINYHSVTSAQITFEGLSAGAVATTGNVEFDRASGTFSIGSAALASVDVTVDEGYKLVLGTHDSDNDNVFTTTASVGASLVDQLYTAEKSAEFYTANNTATITYTAADGGDTIQFSGLQTTLASAISVADTVITLADSAFGDLSANATVGITTDGYALALGTGQNTVTTTQAALNKQVYTTEGYSAGYTLSDSAREIVYSTATFDTIGFNGLQTTLASAISVADTVITLADSAFGDLSANATIDVETAGYTFALGTGQDAVTTVGAALSDDLSVYRTTGDQAGYTLGNSDREIIYSIATFDTIGFSGLASGTDVDDITVDTENRIITLNTDAIGEGTVSISSDKYTLQLGDLTHSTTVSASYDNNTFTSAGSTNGYSLASGSKSISYVSGTSKDFTFTGVADAATVGNFYLSGKTLTIGKDAIKTDGTAIVLTNQDDYKLKIGRYMDTVASDIAETVSTADSITTYTSAGKSEYYALGDGERSIVYNEATSKDFTFTGIADGATTDNFYLKGKTLTIAEAAAKTDGTSVKLTNQEDYTLKLGKTMATEATTVEAAVSTDDSITTYTSAGETGFYSLGSDSRSIDYTTGTSKDFTFTGIADGATTDNFYLKGKTLTIGEAAAKTDGTSIKLTNQEDYTLKLGRTMATVATTLDAPTLSTDDSITTYQTAGTTGFYSLGSDSRSIDYTTGTSKDFTFTGIADGATTDNFYLKGKTITIGEAAAKTDGTSVVLTNQDDYTLKLGKTMATEAATLETATVSAKDSITTYQTAGTTGYYSLGEGERSIDYTAGTSKDFTFTGIVDGATTSDFYLKGKTITIAEAASKADGTSIKLTNQDDYTLKLGKTMATEATTLETATLSTDDSITTYQTAGTTGYYSLGSDSRSIDYTAGTSKAFKFTGIVDGATTSDFYLKGKTLTIAEAASKADGTSIKLTNQDDYTLKLGKTMATEAATLETATVSTKDAITTYQTAGTTGYYSLGEGERSIDYTAGTSKAFKFTGIVDGATTSDFYLKGKTLTIAEAASKADGTSIKLTNQDDYTLKLGKTMATVSSTVDKANYDADSMTYQTAGTTGYYSLSSDSRSIDYTTGTSKDFKFTGVSDEAETANFYLKGKTITIGKAAVKTDGTSVVLTNQDDYTLKLGKGMSTTSSTTTETELDDSGKYTVKEVSGSYALGSDSRSITFSGSSSTKLELSGIESIPADPSNDTVTLGVSNMSSAVAVTSNSGNYKFSIASGTYTGKTFTGSSTADTIANAATGLVINAGNGNDSIKSSGSGSTINGGAGNDTVAGSTGADNINGDAGNDLIWGGAGNDYIKGGAGNDSLSGYSGDDTINGGDGADTLLGGAGKDILWGGAGNDYMEGNAGNDSLSGAAGNDTLWGGAGNDTLIGGAGNDTFIYKPNEGTDHITDYATGDLVQIVDTSGKSVGYTNSSFSGSKLTLTIDGGGTLVFDKVSDGQTINVNGTNRTIKDGKLS